MPRSKLLFLLTDGGRARFVERSPENGHYVTFEAIDDADQLRTLRRELRASPPARSISSTSPRRSAIGPEEDLRDAKAAFAARVADRAVEICRTRAYGGVVIAAPPRLLRPLKTRLENRAALAAVIRKDLAKTPDGQLGAWLNDVFVPPTLTQ